MPLFQVENLTYYYPGAHEPALRNLNLEIDEGEFVLVTGGSGSGKSSLARVLAGLLPDFYGGRCGGKVFFKGKELRSLDRRKLAREVGMVFQDPEKQIVRTSVEAEIAFGLENLGLEPQEMLRRTAEMIGFTSLTPLRESFIEHLSGGQKQKVVLASILATQPCVLILDEPTSQLDPVSAEEILNLVRRLNEEMGFTVILIEQRLERCFHLADRVLPMEKGEIIFSGPPAAEAREAIKKGLPYAPPVARLFAGLNFARVPVTVNEGRRILRSLLSGASLATEGSQSGGEYVRTKKEKTTNSAVRMQNVWFAYPEGREALKGIDLELNAGELVAVLGENGAGKSTLLKNIIGLFKPGRGKIYVRGKEPGREGGKEIRKIAAYLSQNPNDYLFGDTVEDELLFTLKNFGIKDTSVVEEILTRLRLLKYRRANPRDLSSGERQRVALASVLVTRPELILLDEPTRGLDYGLKAELGSYLQEEARAGRTVVVVTQDAEFAAEFATRVVVMFDGRLVADGEKHAVLDNSIFIFPANEQAVPGYLDGSANFG